MKRNFTDDREIESMKRQVVTATPHVLGTQIVPGPKSAHQNAAALRASLFGSFARLRSCAAALSLLLALLLATPSLLAGNEDRVNGKAGRVLVVHDSTGQWGWVGQVYGRQILNLLGHFDGIQYDMMAVEQYRKGTVNDYRAMFYLGSVWNNGLPAAFTQDVLSTAKTVVWFKYNLWQVSGHANKLGFQMQYMVQQSSPGAIRYNGQTFGKYATDPELGLVTILNPAVAKTVAVATGNQYLPELPYVVRSNNFWYFADIPFSYVSEEDRYLVFCDVLHDILGINHQFSRRALLRLEDVHPNYDPQTLREIADYLYSQGVPFQIALIPVYSDPLGAYNGGVPMWVPMSSKPEFVAAIKYMVARGGSIVLHGYTHQYGKVANPYTGVSGDDYEFFRVTIDSLGRPIENKPVSEDSVEYVSERLLAAKDELKKCGLTEVAWEVPHYAASALDYMIFAKAFDLTNHRVLYFDYAIPTPCKIGNFIKTAGGGLTKGSLANHEVPYFSGQFFPYVIQEDIYGQKIAPENLGNVVTEAWNNYPTRPPDSIVNAAQKNLAIRDSFASHYFHPFLWKDDPNLLKHCVEGIKALGFRYVPLTRNIQ